MLEPAELYELTEAEVPAAAPVLIVALEGFVDAGTPPGWPSGAMREGREVPDVAGLEGRSRGCAGSPVWPGPGRLSCCRPSGRAGPPRRRKACAARRGGCFPP